MRKFHLHLGESIQGEFSLKKLNLLLIFQVNCPGCFVYALPVFNVLFQKYHSEIGFIGLSTAFEDFNYNNLVNTKKLIQEGTLVGETKHVLEEMGHFKLSYPLEFPIVMDQKLESSQQKELAENICHLNPNYSSWQNVEKDILNQRVENYLNSQEEVSMTFTANQFRGTPSFALFNDSKELLHSWFGHVRQEDIIQKIEAYQ